MIRLTRTDPDRNMARFYVVAVERDLFDGVNVVREWGRIGQPGTVRRDPCADEATATAAAGALIAAKRRRGYSEAFPAAGNINQNAV